MIINNTFKFIFIHIPKSAGTSITNFLSELNTYCDLEIGGTSFGENIQSHYRKRFSLYKHAPAFEIRNIIGHKEWKKFFSFAFVRNPFTRVYSIYNFLKKWENLPEKYGKMMEQFESFEEFILSELLEKDPGFDNIFRPQVFWVCEFKKNNYKIIDFIGKVENLKGNVKIFV